MSKNLVRNFIFIFNIVFCSLLTEGAFAKIPLKSYKGVTRCFYENKRHFSPTIGAAASESGLINNKRFYGNYTPAYKEDGSRAYQKDSSGDDPFWNMVYILFPSTGGSLGTDTEGSSNFGRHVEKPQTVALLLNFADAYRSNRSELTQEEKRNRFINKWKEKLFLSLNTPSGDAKRKSRKLMQQIMSSIDHEMESLNNGEVPFYPPYTTEQILSSFFHHKFNTQGDIWELLKNLDDSIVDKEKIPNAINEWEYEELKSIACKSEAYDMDDILFLATADIWSSPTPYREGSPPLSNGNARIYNRTNDQLESKTFADCVEIMARHLINISLYDPYKKEFDLTNIRNYVAPDNPYFKNFEEFYQLQTPSLSNAGSVEIRSLWNRVVADLNDGSDIQIKYLKNNNDINPGFINLLKVFQKIFSLKIAPPPADDFKAMKQWLENSFKVFFEALNPNKIYKIDLDHLKEDGDDISGDLPVTVQSKEGNDEASFTLTSIVSLHSEIKDLKNLKKKNDSDFTQNLKIHPTTINDHTTEESLWLLSPSDEIKTSKINLPFYLLFKKGIFDNNSKINFLETLNKIFDSWESRLTKRDLMAFQGIFGNILNDISWQDNAVLEKISPLILELSTKKNLEGTLSQNVKGIKITENKDALKVSEVISKFKHIESLMIHNLASISKDLSTNIYFINNLEIIDLTGLTQLRKIDLSKSSIREVIGINTLENLVDLNLRETPSFEKAVLSNLRKLESLDISSSGIMQIELNNLTALETLELSNTCNLEYVSFKELGKLRHLNLYNSSVETIEGLDTLKGMQELHLDKTNYLGIAASFSDLENLRHLDLSDSSVTKVYGLGSLINIEYLNLANINALKEISLKEQEYMQELNLFGSGIKKVELDSLKSLVTICLTKSEVETLILKNLYSITELSLNELFLEDVVFEGSFPSLRSIDFSSSNGLKSIKGLENLRNLEKLNVQNTPNLEYIIIGKGKNNSLDIQGKPFHVRSHTLTEDKIDFEYPLKRHSN